MTKVQRISHFISKLSLWQLWLVAFAPKLIWWLAVVLFGDASFTMYDSAQFQLLSENMLNHGEFSRSLEAPFFPDIARTPGYPLFLLPFVASSAALSVIALVQSMLAAFVPVMLFKAAKRLQLASAQFAFLILALDISLLLFMPLILSDGLFLILLSFLIYQMTKEKHHWSSYLLDGILLGALVLVRPIAMFLPLLFLLFLVAKPATRKGALLLLLGCVLFPGGWTFRNYKHFNTATISSMSSNNLLLYNAANVYANNEGISFAKAQRTLAQEALEQFDWNNDKSASKKYISYCQERAMEIITSSPSVFIEQVGHSIAFYFFKPPRSYFDKVFELNYNYSPIDGLGAKGSLLSRLKTRLQPASAFSLVLSLISLVFNVLVFGLAVRGAFSLLKKHPQLALLLIGGALYFCFLSVFTATDARFRLPAVPFLALLAAAAPIRTRSTGSRR